MHRPLIMLLRNDFEYIADPDEDPAPIVFYKPYIPKQIHKRSSLPTPPMEIHQRPDIDAVKQEKTEKPIEKPIIVTDNSYYWLPIPIWEFIMRKLSLIDLARCMQVHSNIFKTKGQYIVENHGEEFSSNWFGSKDHEITIKKQDSITSNVNISGYQCDKHFFKSELC
eukprot:TRINITY_DN6252_c0_g1_i8.p1 TRINITY_DN6252_c0_g1~~TRINITY_DN6252_c0_g1_i8.p1  ORF type:complete len:167 (-),score=22.12 TRINITY_DN6252_c0_g1_i8:171-671(-)